MMPKRFISRITPAPNALTPPCVCEPRALSQMSLSPLWQSVIYLTPRFAKYSMFDKLPSSASPFSIPRNIVFRPSCLFISKSSFVRAMEMSCGSVAFAMSSILLKISSAYSFGPDTSKATLSVNFSPGFGCGR